MSLTRSQYDNIMREYEHRRERSRKRAEEARREVLAKIPQYGKIESGITDIAMACAERVLEGDTGAIALLKKETERLEEQKKELLAANGFAEDHLEEKYECSDCKDTGYIDGSTKCHCLRQAILRFLYRQSNIEDVLAKENFDTLRYDIYTDQECEKMKGIIAKCRRFADDFGKEYRNMLLLGNVGVGKTFLTNCMTKSVIDKGYSVIYFTSIRLFDTLSRERFGYNYDEDDPDRMQDDIYTCDLLIIDDLGTESINSFVAGMLFDILNERFLQKKPVIISTNLSLEELMDRYSERSISRIIGYYDVVHPEVADIRIRMKRRSSN